MLVLKYNSLKKQLAVSWHITNALYLFLTKSFMLLVRGGIYAFCMKLVDSNRAARYAQGSNALQFPYLISEPFSKTTTFETIDKNW